LLPNCYKRLKISLALRWAGYLFRGLLLWAGKPGYDMLCYRSSTSPDVRYAAIARLRHVECSENGYKAYTDIWREFPAIRQAMAENKMSANRDSP
jgi:hypothetical protein